MHLEQMEIEEIDLHREKIVAKVWDFVDEIANGTIGLDLLNELGISEIAVSAVQKPGYVGNKVYRDSIFRHLLDSIGYYELLCKGEDIIIELSLNEVEKRLRNPKSWSGFTRKEMANYPLITGVKESVDLINSVLTSQDITNGINSLVPAHSRFCKVDRGFDISFNLPFDKTRGENFNQQIENIQFNVGKYNIIVPEHGSFVSKWRRSCTPDDEVSIMISRFNTCGVKAETEYYQRYITEIKDWGDIHRNIAIGQVSLDGYSTYGSFMNFDGDSYALYFFDSGDKKYLAIDSNVKVTENRMRDITFSILVSIGLITGNLFLNEYWMVASDDKETRHPVGLFYSSLISSVRSDYTIFTTNVYSVLIPAAKKIDPIHGESRALRIIENYRLAYAIDAIPIAVFERLVENFDRYESLQRGVFILLTGTHLPLELQAGAFAISLEAICNITKHIIPDEKTFKLSGTAWKNVLPKLKKLIEDEYTSEHITNEERGYLFKKIESLNSGFNSDKLSLLLKHFDYPLTKEDNLAISLRNPLLHGDINIKKLKGSEFDKLFSLSLRLHKLCCSIPLMMAGYNGYIINNCKLFGFENSCKSFIKLEKHKKETISSVSESSKDCILTRLAGFVSGKIKAICRWM